MSALPPSFELRVQFSGVCLYARHPQQRTITVVMPDARGRDVLKHIDQSEAEPHVGYLRFDLANLDTHVQGAQSEAIDSPAYEVVHRFDREQVELDVGGAPAPVGGEPGVPDFDDFAPVLEVSPDVLEPRPPETVLMRMTLSGGTIDPLLDDDKWTIPRPLAPNSPGGTRSAPSESAFGGVVEWTREVHGNGLTIRLRRFKDGRTVTIPLRPTTLPGDVPAIAVKIANLCAKNPLEWEELPERLVTNEDADFRWLYKLLRLRPDQAGVTFPPEHLPTPVLVRAAAPAGSRFEGSAQNCFGGRITSPG